MPYNFVGSDCSCLTFLYFRGGNIPGNFILSDRDIKIIVKIYSEGLKILETLSGQTEKIKTCRFQNNIEFNFDEVKEISCEH